VSTTSAATTPLWVFGATGILAGELLRLVERHPALRLAGAVSRTPRPLAQAHPHWPGNETTCSAAEAAGAIAESIERGARPAVVLALPHGESALAWLELRARLGPAAERLVLADLSADFRLRDPDLYAETYGRPHPAPEELAGFAYGLPELFEDDVRRARRIAAPGCFATALQLAVVPAARAGLLDTSRPWILHAITGSSGSGAEPKPGTHHPHRHGNLWAYGLDGHRHEAELRQALAPLGIAPPLHFVPHSGPFARGIHLTAALPLRAGASLAQAREAYAAAYTGRPFVELLDSGVPDLRSVAGSNRAQIALHARGGVLSVLATLDNLVKGGAGQALQCLNLVLGLPEADGLPRAGLGAC